MIDIDNETGTLQLHQSFVKIIDSATELRELKRVLPSWEQTNWKDGCSSLKVEIQNNKKDETLHIQLHFIKSKLTQIELFFTAEFLGDGHSRWSKAKEVRRKKYHEALFSIVLGKHEWGSVQSVLGNKEGYSFIRLEYYNLGT